MMVPVSIEEREEIDAYNAESRDHMQRLLDEDKRLVCEWIVVIEGIHRIFAARIIKIFLSLFAFTLQVAVIFLPENAQKYLFLLAVLTLTPFAFVEALGALAQFGGSMLRVTDAELDRELYYIKFILKLLFCCISAVFSWICCCCCRTKTTADNTNTNTVGDNNEIEMEMEMVALDKIHSTSETLSLENRYPDNEITMHSSNPMHDNVISSYSSTCDSTSDSASDLSSTSKSKSMSKNALRNLGLGKLDKTDKTDKNKKTKLKSHNSRKAGAPLPPPAPGVGGTDIKNIKSVTGSLGEDDPDAIGEGSSLDQDQDQGQGNIGKAGSNLPPPAPGVGGTDIGQNKDQDDQDGLMSPLVLGILNSEKERNERNSDSVSGLSEAGSGIGLGPRSSSSFSSASSKEKKERRKHLAELEKVAAKQQQSKNKFSRKAGAPLPPPAPGVGGTDISIVKSKVTLEPPKSAITAGRASLLFPPPAKIEIETEVEL